MLTLLTLGASVCSVNIEAGQGPVQTQLEVTPMKAPKIAFAVAALALSQASFAAGPVDQYLTNAGFENAPTTHEAILNVTATRPGNAADRYLVDAGYEQPVNVDHADVCALAPVPVSSLDAASRYLVDAGYENTFSIALADAPTAKRTC